MPNVSKPSGLSPWRFNSGASWNGQCNLYHIPATYAVLVGIGDLVKSVATSDARGVPDVVIATGTTDVVRGVVVGWLPTGAGTGVSLVGTSLALESELPAASTDRYVLVCDDPNVIFKAQLDNGTVPASAALSTMMNKNFSQGTVAHNAYVATTPMSTATFAVTQALTLKSLGLIQGPENNGVDLTLTTGQFAYIACKINLHELGSVGTVGV